MVVFEGKESKAMADQLSSAIKERLFLRASILSQEEMARSRDRHQGSTGHPLEGNGVNSLS